MSNTIPSNSEARFLRREIIGDYILGRRKSVKEICGLVRKEENERFGFELNLFSDWIQPTVARRNHYDNEFPVYYDAQGREHAEF